MDTKRSQQLSPLIRLLALVSLAFHTFGGLDMPPVTELVRLPDGRPVRTMAANEALKAKVETLQRKRVEFFKLDIGEGVQVDGWRILPPDFDPAKKYPLFVYVYVEPASQTVQDNCGGSGYLWHLRGFGAGPAPL